jgi:hypothetical protein
MPFNLIPITQALDVEGSSELGAVGSFSGTVIAIGLRDTDPIASVGAEAQTAGDGEPEGLLGWGTTHFLVADPEKPAPVWVGKNDIESHRLGE